MADDVMKTVHDVRLAFRVKLRGKLVAAVMAFGRASIVPYHFHFLSSIIPGSCFVYITKIAFLHLPSSLLFDTPHINPLVRNLICFATVRRASR
jgi:hypothetical protein